MLCFSILKEYFVVVAAVVFCLGGAVAFFCFFVFSISSSQRKKTPPRPCVLCTFDSHRTSRFYQLFNLLPRNFALYYSHFENVSAIKNITTLTRKALSETETF